MRYANVQEGEFIERVNRFVALARVDGETVRCHVKNTGRLRELFVSGAPCVLTRSDNPNRATRFDLVAVRRGDVLVNVDSQAPNEAAFEWVRQGGLGEGVTCLKREYTWGNSRFDLYAERKEEKLLIEVKGVTLNVNGEARFPDAPTERGEKHVRELIRARREGFRTAIVFAIQMEDVRGFAPNDDTDPAFGAALREAASAGVELHAVRCRVEPDRMELIDEVPVRL